MHPIIDQLSNDTNMAGVDAMCSGYNTSEFSEVSFVFIKATIPYVRMRHAVCDNKWL